MVVYLLLKYVNSFTVPEEHCTVLWVHSYSQARHQRYTFRYTIMFYSALNVLQIKTVNQRKNRTNNARCIPLLHRYANTMHTKLELTRLSCCRYAVPLVPFAVLFYVSCFTLIFLFNCYHASWKIMSCNAANYDQWHIITNAQTVIFYCKLVHVYALTHYKWITLSSLV